MKQNILYRIYYGHKIVFVGATNFDLTSTLRVDFFGQNSLDIARVSKIEYATLPSMADCIVYKTYFINKLKPLCNKSDRSRDELSNNIVLPELNFVEYNNSIVGKWKEYDSEQLNLFKQF